MGSAYTPGLTVSGDIVVRRTRRLPIKGEVLVKVGQTVEPSTVVAQAKLPGVLQTIRVSERLGVEPSTVPGLLNLKPGDPIQKGDLLVETKALFGLIKNRVESDYVGTVETVSEVTGSVLVREPSIPVDLTAYIHGTVAEVIPSEGAIIETRGAMVQGIFGVGGEREGVIRVACGIGEALEAKHVRSEDKGAILVGGGSLTFEAIQRAEAVGAVGILVASLRDEDLIRYLGYDIGVAITGQEPIPLTILATEGFGHLPMARRTHELLTQLADHKASINGATQIRAGVIRPEVIVPREKAEVATGTADSFELRVGAPIRVIREPYFGALGTVTELPAQLVTLESGTEVRVLRAKLLDGQEVTVPRANVEITAGS